MSNTRILLNTDDPLLRKKTINHKAASWELVRVERVQPARTPTPTAPDGRIRWNLTLLTSTGQRITDRFKFWAPFNKRAMASVMAIMRIEPGLSVYVEPKQMLNRLVWCQLAFYKKPHWKKSRTVVHWYGYYPYMGEK